MAKDIGFRYVYITSNGAIADIEKVKPCIDAGLNSLRFSINGHNREMYQFIHGKDDFDVVIKNLKDISKYKEDNEIKDFNLYTSTILTKYTLDKKEELQQMLSEYVTDMVFMYVSDTSGGTISNTISDCYVDDSEKFTCIQPFNVININVEGYLTACCDDRNNYLVMADLNKMSLREAWESPTYVEFRKRFMAKDIKGLLCENCIHKTTNPIKPWNDEFSVDFQYDEKAEEAFYNERKKLLV